MAAIEVPQPCCTESQLAMQLMMDRVLKKMIEKRANAMEHFCTHRNVLAPLTMRERSAIRYMAGFVAIKLLKRLFPLQLSGSRRFGRVDGGAIYSTQSIPESILLPIY